MLGSGAGMGALTAGNKNKRKTVVLHLLNKVRIEINVSKGS